MGTIAIIPGWICWMFETLHLCHFKNALLSAMDRHILSKFFKPNSNLPWFKQPYRKLLGANEEHTSGPAGQVKL